MKRIRPPKGVLPYYLWIEDHPDPTLEQELKRYTEVLEAVRRYREAKMTVSQKWICELLGYVGYA
jgi:hypothetical protein